MLRILLMCVVAFPLLTSYRGGGEERGGDRGEENRDQENRAQGNFSQQQKNEGAAYHHSNENNLNYQQKQDVNRAYDNRGYGNYGGNVYVAPQPQTIIEPVQEYPQTNNSPYINTPGGAVYPDLSE